MMTTATAIVIAAIFLCLGAVAVIALARIYIERGRTVLPAPKTGPRR